MSIPDNLLAEIVIQDIVNTDSTRATQTPFNTSFKIETIANFYTMDSNSLLTCHHSEEHEDSNIENDTS